MVEIMLPDAIAVPVTVLRKDVHILRPMPNQIQREDQVIIMKAGHTVRRELQVQAREHILRHPAEVLQGVVLQGVVIPVHHEVIQGVVIPVVRPVDIQEVVLQVAVPQVLQEAAPQVLLLPQVQEVEVVEGNLNLYFFKVEKF
jgi:hypothetical protein